MFLFGPPNINKLAAKRDVKGLAKALIYKKDVTVRKAAIIALANIGDQTAVEAITSALEDESHDVRIAAVKALVNIGDVKSLTKALGSTKDEAVRAAAIKALAKTSDRTAFDLITSALEDENLDVRREAAKVLKQSGDVRAVQPLLTTFRSDKSVNWVEISGYDAEFIPIHSRSAIPAQALVAIGEPAVEPLVSALKDENAGIRAAAAEALGEIGDARAIDPLISALNDRIDDVLAAAARALAKIGDARAVEPLIAVLQMDDHFSQIGGRAAVAETLGKIGDARAIEPLTALCEAISSNSHVRVNAIEALRNIAGVRAVETLIPLLEDQRFEIRVAAANALGEIGDARATEPLMALLKEEKGNTKAYNAAYLALKKLEQIRLTNTIESFVASLISGDHNARKEAINALPSSGSSDMEDTRAFSILERAPGVVYDQIDLERDIHKFPDFYMAYLRAAYPTNNSSDHSHANIALLLDGLIKSKAKGDILARLSCYYTWKEDWIRALDCVTAAILLGNPSEGPGDMVQVLVFLRNVFDLVGLHKEADMAKRVKAPYSLGPNEATAVEKAVAALADQYNEDVRWAADKVREKLSNVLQKRGR